MSIKTNLDAADAERNAIHTGTFKLPSCGRLYPEGFPETMDIRAFGFAVEDLLVQPGPVLRKLLNISRDVVTNFPPNFDHEQLLAGDVFAIIAVARGLTYGQDYQFAVSCPECGSPEVITIRVPQELPIISWEDKSLEDLQTSWTTLLPGARDSVRIQPLTIKEDLAVEDSKRIAKATGGEDLPALFNVAAHIREVNGGTPDNLMDSVRYVKRLRGADVSALNDLVAGCSPGIKLGYEILCDSCSHQYSVTMPLSSDFFRRNRV